MRDIKPQRVVVNYDVSDFTEEQRFKMMEAASKLKKKFPHMKPERIAKKVAAMFNIKLINDHLLTPKTTNQVMKKANLQFKK